MRTKKNRHRGAFFFASLSAANRLANTGAGEEARTLDLYLGKVSLYQLSYSRRRDRYYRDTTEKVKPRKQFPALF